MDRSNTVQTETVKAEGGNTLANKLRANKSLLPWQDAVSDVWVITLSSSAVNSTVTALAYVSRRYNSVFLSCETWLCAGHKMTQTDTFIFTDLV